MSFWRNLFGGYKSSAEPELDPIFEDIDECRGMFSFEQLQKARAQWLSDYEDPPRPETREFAKEVFNSPVDESKCIELLEAGANPNVRAGVVPTGLNLACEHGRLELVKAMLKHGAFPDQQGSYEDTSLCIALSEGHSDIAMMLIEAGANVNTTGNSRLTPLIIAASNGNNSFVKELIDRGADAEYRVPAQYRGMNAEETAEHRDHKSTANLIRKLKSQQEPAVRINHGAKYPDYGDEYHDEFFDARCHMVDVDLPRD